MLGRSSRYLCHPWNVTFQILPYRSSCRRTPIPDLRWECRRTTWYFRRTYSNREVHPMQFDGVLGGLARGKIDSVECSKSVLSCSRCGQNAYKEVITWKNLDHPNILPLLGVDTSISPLSAISAQMEHGNLKEYLVCFPNAPRSKLVR